MKAIVQIGIGEPDDILSLQEIPSPVPADDGVVIDVSLASVHHGDLFFIRSVRTLPDGTKHIGSGIEAVGRIRSIGRGVPETRGLRVGGRAAVSLVSGAWAEQVAVPGVHAFPVPDDIPDTTAAQLFISALTARMVVRAIQRSVPDNASRGGAVLLTGASTAVARIIAHFMLQEDLTIIGLTRSEAAAARTTRLVPGVPFVATQSEGWQDSLHQFFWGGHSELSLIVYRVRCCMSSFPFSRTMLRLSSMGGWIRIPSG